MAELVKHRSLIVIVSDFLVDPESLRSPLAFLRARRHEVVLLRVLDPLEIEFQHERPVLIRDLETGDERFVDTTMMAQSYRRRFEDHRRALEDLLAPLGVQSVVFKTTDPMELVLSSFLSMRGGTVAS